MSEGVYVLPFRQQTASLSGLLLAEIALQHGSKIYQIPNSVDPTTVISKPEVAEQYLMTPFTSQMNNGNGVNGYDTYVISNQVYNSLIVQSINGKPINTVMPRLAKPATVQIDNNFTSNQYVMRAPSGTKTMSVVPTQLLIPFVMVNGTPLMDLGQYITLLGKLLPVQQLNYPKGYNTSVQSPTVVMSNELWTALQTYYTSKIQEMVELANGNDLNDDFHDMTIPYIQTKINDAIEAYTASINSSGTNTTATYVAISYPSNFQLPIYSNSDTDVLSATTVFVYSGLSQPDSTALFCSTNQSSQNLLWQLVQDGYDVGNWTDNISSPQGYYLGGLFGYSNLGVSPVKYTLNGFDTSAFNPSSVSKDPSCTFEFNILGSCIPNLQNLLSPFNNANLLAQTPIWPGNAGWQQFYVAGQTYSYTYVNRGRDGSQPLFTGPTASNKFQSLYEFSISDGSAGGLIPYPANKFTYSQLSNSGWSDARWPIVPTEYSNSIESFNWVFPSIQWQFQQSGPIAAAMDNIDVYSSFLNYTSSQSTSKSFPYFYLPGPFQYMSISSGGVMLNNLTNDSGTSGRAYLGLNSIQFTATYFSTINANQVSMQSPLTKALITIPTLNIQVTSLSAKHTPSNDLDEFDKLSEGYFGCADLIVSAYYNQLLQKAYYFLYQYNQNAAATLLQQLLGIAVKFNYLSDLLTEWVQYHPFDTLPPVTHQLLYAINEPLPTSDRYNEVDVSDSVNNFFATVIPNAVPAYQLPSSITQQDVQDVMPNVDSSLQGLASNMFVDLGSDLSSVPELLPNVFRTIVKAVMAHGAILSIVDSYARLLKLHQIALKSEGMTDSNGDPVLPQDVLNPTSKDLMTVNGHINLNEARYQYNSHKSSSMHPLIYPTFDAVIEDIKTDVDAIRYLTEDRLHGLSYTLYKPELHDLLMRRTKHTHALTHLFVKSLHLLKDFINKFHSLENTLNRLLLTPIDTLILRPISHIAVAIGKFTLSALLDMTACVSPGSEILDLLQDVNIKRPLPFPQSPFPIQSDPLFHGVVLNGGSGTNDAAQIESIECIIPFVGLSNRSGANCAYIYSTTAGKFALVITPKSASGTFSKITNIHELPPECENGGQYIMINDVKPGLNYISLATTAGTCKMWFSATFKYGSDSFISNGLSPLSGQLTFIGTNGLFCFVPDPAVSLDERIDLPKTFHKWIISAIALPGIFFPGIQGKTYKEDVKLLDKIPGFENFSSHISTTDYIIAMTADAAAGTTAYVTAISRLCSNDLGVTEGQILEPYTVAAESFANMQKITTVYNRSQSVNVLNAYISNKATINKVITDAWTGDPDSVKYSLGAYNFFDTHTVATPDLSIPAWFPESVGRLLGDIMMGIAKIGAFLFAQHHVFKKWDKRNDPQTQNKTKLRSVLWNHLMKVKNDDKLNNDFKQDLAQENHSFVAEHDKSALREFENDNSKSIRKLLSSNRTDLQYLEDILSTLSGFRGLN